MRKIKVKDHFYYKAKREGYPARSVYKLQEIDEKYRMVKMGDRVLDLGCSPGSWSKYCSNKVGGKGLVVGVDKERLLHPGLQNTKFLQRDILKMDLGELRRISPVFDVVLSDLAPATTGTKEVDQIRSLELGQAAYNLAQEVLRPGGYFVCKLFQGPDMIGLLKEMRERFMLVKTVKPAGSRKGSFEVYLVGCGYKNQRQKTKDQEHKPKM